jgi:hypothetical protein
MRLRHNRNQHIAGSGGATIYAFSDGPVVRRSGVKDVIYERLRISVVKGKEA